MEKYRDLSKRTELVIDLKKRVEVLEFFEVWQPPVLKSEINKKRESFFASLVEVCLKDSILTFSMKDNDHIKVDPERIIYFVSKDHQCVFKADFHFEEGPLLKVEFPEKISVVELRSNPRKAYSLEEGIETFFEFTSDSGEKTLGKAPVLNSSDGGICIYLSKETLSKLENAVSIFFPELNELTSELESSYAEIRHTRLTQKAKLNIEEHFQVGLQFNGSEN